MLFFPTSRSRTNVRITPGSAALRASPGLGFRETSYYPSTPTKVVRPHLSSTPSILAVVGVGGAGHFEALVSQRVESGLFLYV